MQEQTKFQFEKKDCDCYIGQLEASDGTPLVILKKSDEDFSESPRFTQFNYCPWCGRRP